MAKTKKHYTDRHKNHPVIIKICKPGSAHHAALFCKPCNKHLQWLSVSATQDLLDANVDCDHIMI